jgi:bifunctional non-homologous end joining protein LigD
MLASPWRAAFTDPEWLFEVKWDGVRALWCWDGDVLSVRSRRGRQVLATYPELSGFRPPQPVVLDGEIVVLDDRGHPSFQMLQARMNMTDGRRASVGLPASYMVFDLLHDGEDLTTIPLEGRRERLTNLALPAPMVVSTQIDGAGEALYQAVVAEGLEGIVAKRRGSLYRSGARSADWRKVAHLRRLSAVVGGFTRGEGARSNSFGALLVGLWDGPALRWVGAVGSGFDERTLAALRSRLEGLEREETPFHSDRLIPASSRWVQPVMVVEVCYKQWTAGPRLRAPVFKGLSATSSEESTWEAAGPSTADVAVTNS